MKLFFFVMLAVVLNNFSVWSQTHRSTFQSTEKVIDIEEKADPKVVFLFDNFKSAKIYYPDKYAELDINYRLLRDEVIVKTDESKVKTLSTRDKFDSILVNNMNFIYNDNFGYLEKIDKDGDFYIKHVTTYITDVVMQGAYGEASPSSSVAKATDAQVGRSRKRGGIRPYEFENTAQNPIRVTLTYRPKLAMIVDDELITFRTRRNLNDVFSDYRSEIRRYVRSENISFDQREDLIRLSEYLKTL